MTGSFAGRFIGCISSSKRNERVFYLLAGGTGILHGRVDARILGAQGFCDVSIVLESFRCGLQQRGIDIERAGIRETDPITEVGLREVVWVILTCSELWQHAGEHLEAQVLFVA